MNVYLLRHGIAEPRTESSDDAERALTGEGLEKTRAVVRGMAALGLRFDRIATSPFLRARQTADLVVERLGGDLTLEVWSALAPDQPAAQVVASLRKLPRNVHEVLLVGHEPDLSQLAALWLTGEPSGLALTLKKAGLVKLAADKIEVGRSATLEWLLTAGQIRRLGASERRSVRE